MTKNNERVIFSAKSTDKSVAELQAAFIRGFLVLIAAKGAASTDFIYLNDIANNKDPKNVVDANFKAILSALDSVAYGALHGILAEAYSLDRSGDSTLLIKIKGQLQMLHLAIANCFGGFEISDVWDDKVCPNFTALQSLVK